MTYAETLDYLYAALPMYQRIGAAAYKANLDNTIALCAALDNPQHKFKSIHIAGTNGKGSSSHMIASVLQCAGYKTGLYTSPHLKDFNERIKINGQPVTQAFVIDFVARIKPELESLRPSFFETTVAMAFEYFARERVDIAVIEVGLGGRLDSTNVITPLVSLITNISFDHKNLLGDTLALIAAEKAGIIKHRVPSVISQHQAETDQVFIDKALQEDSPIAFGADHYRINETPAPGIYDIVRDGQQFIADLECGLKGYYQRKNLPGVFLALERLQEAGFKVPLSAMKDGIQEVVTLTGLKGRWQTLAQNPLTICDIGHNEDGIREVLLNINRTPHNKLHIIFGMVNDKDISGVIGLLPRDASYYFCEAKIPRAMPAATLAAKAQEAGLDGKVVPDVNEAVEAARANAAPDDLVFIGGSTFVVAELANL